MGNGRVHLFQLYPFVFVLVSGVPGQKDRITENLILESFSLKHNSHLKRIVGCDISNADEVSTIKDTSIA